MKEMIEYLTDLLAYLEYSNRMAPFPVYDTEYVGLIRKDLEDMKKGINKYDEAPVVACKFCDDSYIVVDELENDICMKCGAVNEIVIYEDIFAYLKSVGHSEDN